MQQTTVLEELDSYVRSAQLHEQFQGLRSLVLDEEVPVC